MDHWFPTDLIHRHEHFGHGAEGVLDVYGNKAEEDSFKSHILIDRFKPHPIDGVVHYHVTRGGDRFFSSGWEAWELITGALRSGQSGRYDGAQNNRRVPHGFVRCGMDAGKVNLAWLRRQ